MKEVVSRPKIHAFWLWVEKKCVPQFSYGYTVNNFIVEELKRRYGVDYGMVRNLPMRNYELRITNYKKQDDTANRKLPTINFFLYQGAVNEGRGFETLIPAMQLVDAPLVIAGDGNFMGRVKDLIAENKLEEKVILLGSVTPNILKTITQQAYAGITIFEDTGLNQYYSLANRFFDYFNGGIPQLCVHYPEYAAINAEYDIALLIPDIKLQTIADGLNNLLTHHVLYERLKKNCDKAAKDLCWENEQNILLAFWANVFQGK
jgi:glycosyltransferase involved in cell wall biosynthesis